MRKSIIMVCVIVMNYSFAQISMQGTKLIKDGQTYKFKDYKDVFLNEEARIYFAKAKTNSTVAQTFGLIGGIGIGIGLSRVIPGPRTIYDTEGRIIGMGKNNYTWGLAGIGLGIVGIGIPFAPAGDRNLKKATI